MRGNNAEEVAESVLSQTSLSKLQVRLKINAITSRTKPNKLLFMSLTFSILRRFLIVTLLFTIQGPIINLVLYKRDGKVSADFVEQIRLMNTCVVKHV